MQAAPCCLLLPALIPITHSTPRAPLPQHSRLPQSKNWADVLVPRARDNDVAIEMVAKEVARRVGLKQEEAAQARESLAP